jgi:hypothetical protein
MSEENRVAEVVQLRQRGGYQPDLGALAREQVRQARQARNLDEAEFAEMLTPLLGWTVTADVVRSWESTSVPPGDVLVAAGLVAHAAGRGTSLGEREDTDIIGRLITDRFADLAEVYPTRAEFASTNAARDLLSGAGEIRVVGLSLNLICQQYGDQAVRALVEAGASLKCLFLDPAGAAIRSREAEEGYPIGHLSALTELNIQILLKRVRDRLDQALRDRVEIATYDQTVRFNILIVDNATCVMQPYLPDSRGIDSPTFVIRRRSSRSGLYTVFDQTFNSLWEQRRAL